MNNIGEKIKFSDFVTLLEKIRNSNGLQQKENYLKKYIENFNAIKSKLKQTSPNSDRTFYCVLRLLLPNIDERTYGIKTTSMGRIYVKVLGLAEDGEDAKKLTYRMTNQTYQGDFAEIVYNVVKTRPSKGCNYSLQKLHELLDSVANNDRKVVEMELTKFFEEASPLEQKWFIRIILKNLRLGIGEKKIFSIYDARAQPLYMKITNLLKVCEMIESGKPIDLAKVEIEIYQHIKAMLCQRLQPTKFKHLFSESAYFHLETKMDGERFQLHMKDGVYKYFSRNGIDYTKNLGKDSNEGCLTPMLSKYIYFGVKSIILDGEMMVWSKSKQVFCVKGENYDVKHLQPHGDLTACFVVFDLLFLNNESYLEYSYQDRVKKINEILKFETGILQLCKNGIVRTLEEFTEKFNEALHANEEGIVLKHPMSTYKPGIRGAGWYKLKPDYVDDIIADLCFIIMGVSFDRTNNFISSYLLGAIMKDNENTITPNNCDIYSVSTINSGLSNVERQKLNNSIRPYLIKEKPQNYIIGKFKADSWLPLNNTVLLDVTASELNKSSDFKTNFTLRFPRITAVRTDKVWLEATTVHELEKTSEENEKVKKIYKREMNINDFNPAKKMKLLAENPYKTIFKENEIQRLSSTLEKTEFCILSGSEDGKYSIENLKTIVLQHGGVVVENPTIKNKSVCIAGKIGFRAKKLIETGQYNILKCDWLINNFFNKKKIEYRRPKPREILFATEEMKKKQKKYFDKYGDSYNESVNAEELKLLFDNMEEPPLLHDSEFELLKSKLYKHCEKYEENIKELK